MDNASGAVIGSIVSYFVPIEDNTVKVQIGIVSSQLISYLISNCNHFKFLKYFRNQHNKLTISNYYNTRINPIYYSIEDYFIKRYISDITNLQLVPKNGEITFTAEQQEFSKKLIDTFKEHQIILEINLPSPNSNDNKDTVSSSKSSTILISSKTASLDVLKQYVEYVCNITKPDSSIITIYKIKLTEYEKSSFVEWDTLYIKTNKNYSNTIVSDDIQRDLFQDISHFIQNEDSYSQKGIPYKRGYLLYGPPGTGKTSIIKAIANTHQLPIFNLDLSTIKSNADMLKLVTEINYLAKNKKYIVTIEDIDRCPLFSTNYFESQRLLKNNTLTIDCLLNMLDGIIETHGRLFFMTANDINVFDKIKDVLFRPGRIDKQLNITYCTKTQICKIIANFYQLEVDDITPKLEHINHNNITPAILIKYLQDFYDDFDGLCHFWNSTKKTITENNEIVGGDGHLNNIKKRLNTNTVDGINTKIKKIKNDIKLLEKKNKKIEKTLLQHQSKIDKNNKAIDNNNNDLSKYNDKLTVLKNKSNKIKKINK